MAATSLAIDDCPTGSLSDNLDYFFEGVSLEVVDLENREPIAAFPTEIVSMSELKQLLSAFRPA